LRSLELPLPSERSDAPLPSGRGDATSRRPRDDWPDTPHDEKQRTAENTTGSPGKWRGNADNVVGGFGDVRNPDTPRPPETQHHYYWTEVPRFMRMWDDHAEKWPKDKQPAATVDRSRDSPGSWRSDSNLHLDADVHARAREAIGNVQQAERSTTGDVHAIEQESIYGGRLEGLDFRLKGEDRLKEKVAEVLKREPGRTPDEVVQEVPVAIRYTFCLNADSYTNGYWDIHQRLEGLGYEMIYSKNYWSNPEYKGINTRWMTPEGRRFEVQFHTRESYHAKQEVTHEAYERIRNPMTSRAEQVELKSFQSEVSFWVPVPAGATNIPDYKKEGL
jgi:hypothetical protein